MTHKVTMRIVAMIKTVILSRMTALVAMIMTITIVVTCSFLRGICDKIPNEQSHQIAM